MKTVFITGASTGIGKETAKLFQSNGWNVIATMRNPEVCEELSELKNVAVLQCDVTDQNSIKQAVLKGLDVFKHIDVLVNNAGYYLLGPLEAATHEQIKQQIDTNLLGLINVTKEMMPYFRKQRAGTIINLSSVAGIISVPLQSLYHATKWGVEGFSESLQFELRPFNIRVKIIEPGVIKTDFYGRSMTLAQDCTLSEYEQYTKKVIPNITNNDETASSASGVAKTIYKAATDSSTKLRYPTGYAKELAMVRKLLPYKIYAPLVRGTMEK